MSAQFWTAMGVLASVIAGAIGAIMLRPKTKAESRKLNAEASHTEWGTLRDEINRLQERVEAQDKRIEELEKLDHDRADREAGLKRENYQLRAKVKKLEQRIEGLEAVFKVGPPTPEQQALLDQLKEIE